MSTILATTTSDGSAANILGRGRLPLHEPETGQFLHRQVDFRRRDAALAAKGRRVGHAAEHQCHQRLSFVPRQPHLFELLGIAQTRATDYLLL
jgi:hypothetical protein